MCSAPAKTREPRTPQRTSGASRKIRPVARTSQRRRSVRHRRRLGMLAAVGRRSGAGTLATMLQPQARRNVRRATCQTQHDHRPCDAQGGIQARRPGRNWLRSRNTRRGWSGIGPAAAGSLREGLGEMFTINRLGLPSELRRCLGTTNLTDINGHSALRDRVRRVKHWQNGSMALRYRRWPSTRSRRFPLDHGLQASLDAEGGP